jgi:hypothetical protein
MDTSQLCDLRLNLFSRNKSGTLIFLKCKVFFKFFVVAIMNPRCVLLQALIVHVYAIVCFLASCDPVQERWVRTDVLWRAEHKACSKLVNKMQWTTQLTLFRNEYSFLSNETEHQISLKTSIKIRIWQDTFTFVYSSRKISRSNVTAITGFELVTARFLQIQVFRTLCKLVFVTLKKVTKILRNLGKYLPIYTT